MEKLPIRLENAITKLYNAFHFGELNAYSCSACAVGNMCNNDDSWKDVLSPTENFNGFRISCNPALKENDFKKVIPFKSMRETGYSAFHLSKIEDIFIRAYQSFGWEHYTDSEEIHKKMQFKGLCAVVEYLCELDNIPNVMNYTKLFETENDKPKYALV